MWDASPLLRRLIFSMTVYGQSTHHNWALVNSNQIDKALHRWETDIPLFKENLSKRWYMPTKQFSVHHNQLWVMGNVPLGCARETSTHRSWDECTQEYLEPSKNLLHIFHKTWSAHKCSFQKCFAHVYFILVILNSGTKKEGTLVMGKNKGSSKS